MPVTENIEGSASKNTPLTRDEVYKTAIEYFNGDEIATDVWMRKYAIKGDNGEFYESTPADMHRRMAKEFARVEVEQSYLKSYDKESLSEYGQNRKSLTEDAIFEYFKNFKYIIPQGSVMQVLGNPFIVGSLSNCIVLPKIHDSYGGICYTDQQLAQLYKRRCGCGIDISTLRPANSNVSNAAGTTTGAVSFMHRFSNTTNEVGQQGRRGALMISIDIAHPDIEQFLDIKADKTSVTGANISVKISDEFMQCVKDGTSFKLQWPIDSDNPEFEADVDAKSIWEKLTANAHQHAEPGLIFWDRQHKYSTSSIYPGWENISTNPCAEIAMQGGDSCRLIAINLFHFVKNPFTPQAEIDFDKLYEVCYETQRLGDHLVDLELESIDKIRAKIDSDPEPDHIKAVERSTWDLLYKNGKEGRRTGIGITALGDMIAALGVKYDSEEGISIAESVMKTKCRAEFDSSIDMAIEKEPFLDFDPDFEKDSEFVQMMKVELPEVYERMMKYGRRNISLSTIAPTGSVSILAATSGGCEPVFELSYTRRTKVTQDEINSGNIPEENIETDELGVKWIKFEIYHPKLNMWKEITGETDVEKSPYFGSTAEDIDWKKRVEMQSTLQKYVTHSISSTINLPKDIPVDVVRDIYFYAWEKGLKGITVYRDGARDGVLIKDSDEIIDGSIVESFAPKRPEILPCDIHYSTINGEEWVFLVGLLNDMPYEVFGGTREHFHVPAKFKTGWIKKNGKHGIARIYNLIVGDSPDDHGKGLILKDINSLFESEEGSYTRMVSMLIRHGAPVNLIHDQLMKIGPKSMFSFERGIARVLKKYITDGAKCTGSCTSCGEKALTYREGCTVCKNCGMSGCS